MFILLVLMIFGCIVGCVFLIFSGKITTAIQQNLQNKYITQYFDDK
jgi:hypothetical protein